MYQNLDRNEYTYREQDPEYRGQPFQSSLAEGPTQERKCRDLFFLILYIAFWVALVVVAGIAFSNGHPHLLAAPFDSTGKQCGYSEGYQDYPLAYFNMKNSKEFACINSCPDKFLTSDNKCMFNNTEMKCSNFGNYSTVRFVGVCYPLNEKFAETIDLGLNFYDEAIADLQHTWPISLATIFTTFFLSIVLMFFIRACGGCLVISVIILYFALIIAFGVVAISASKGQIDIPIPTDLQDPQLLQTIGIVCFVLAGISFIVLLCTFRKIKIGILVLKTTAQFTQQQCQTILVPVFMFISIAIFFVLWITVSIYIFSSGKVTQCNGSPYACIDWNVGVKRSLGFYFFGLFWNCEVAIGMCQFVIASTTAYWYFSLFSQSSVSSPVCKSFVRGLVYHLGSIAFGALILCILVILQIIFEVLHHFSKEKTVSTDPITNACMDCCIKYTRCCLACFERFIRFISHNAFIMMAITGDGFCTSAHQAFYLVMRSSIQYAISHGVGHVIMFFGKLFISAICTFAGYLMITEIDYFSEQMFSPIMPTIMFFVISFVIGSLFMDVFGVGSDTLLLCYCLEKDILKGISRCCPDRLRAVLEN